MLAKFQHLLGVAPWDLPQAGEGASVFLVYNEATEGTDTGIALQHDVNERRNHRT